MISCCFCDGLFLRAFVLALALRRVVWMDVFSMAKIVSDFTTKSQYKILVFFTIFCLGTNMNKMWPKQEAFVARVKRFCMDNDLLTQRGALRWEEVGDVFEISPVTLRQLMQYKSRCRPRIDRLIHIARVIGCSVSEFLDSPSDPPPGMSKERWAGLTERERTLAAGLLADIATDSLSATEKEELYNLFQEGKERILRLRQARMV